MAEASQDIDLDSVIDRLLEGERAVAVGQWAMGEDSMGLGHSRRLVVPNSQSLCWIARRCVHANRVLTRRPVRGSPELEH